MSSNCSSKSCGGSAKTCGAAQATVSMQDLSIKRALGKIKQKLLVMSGKGGVGKSTMSVNIALGLANRGYKVGLMDVDLHGPDICRMLGLSGGLNPTEKNKLIPPMHYNDTLSVVSIEQMLRDRDEAIIWRGPLKVQAIRQFIADIDWGELDFLVVDAPPGTGDEPLAVAQNIKDVRGIIVTTPQEVALADVRKSINFCRHLNMKITGLIENMSGLVCPHCDKTIELFKTGGGRKTAAEFNLDFLGAVPMEPQVVMGGDSGAPFLATVKEGPAAAAFAKVLDNIVRLTVDRGVKKQ